MTERIVRAQQALAVGDGSQVLVEHLLGVDNRTNLEQIEIARHPAARTVQIAGELNLHRPAHLLGTILLCHL